MKAIAAIRTNRWGEEEEQIWASLRQAFGDDVVVVFHNRPKDVVPPLPVIDVTETWLTEQRLEYPPDWGWRCGDYFYYALRTARPDYDHYWLAEPDVFFNGNTSGFFDCFKNTEADVLGLNPTEHAAQSHNFNKTLTDVTPCRAIFALTRFSGRALDRLFQKRIKYSAGARKDRTFANDEFFTFSHANADPDLTIADLSHLAPSWFENAQFATDPDLLLDWVQHDPLHRDTVSHPVRGKVAFKAIVARRLASRRKVIWRLGPSLNHLGETDIDDIAQEASQLLKDLLQQQVKR